MSLRVSEPGIYAPMSAEDYHADPCPAPSLSASIAHVLLAYSPLHAWTRHPRLNPAFAPEESEPFDLGRASHALVLEADESRFEICEFNNWTSKIARLQRDDARHAGKIPLLRSQYDRVQAMAQAALKQLLRQHPPPPPLTLGDPERTLVWREGAIWCRARLDWLSADYRTIDDLKTTGASANPEAFSRALFAMGHDVQAAFYLRGLRALTGSDAAFRFVVQETFPPYALSVIGLTPEALMLAEKKVLLAIEIWTDCLARNRWPAYPRRVCYASLPPWIEAQWLERELRPQDVDDGRPISDLLAGDTPWWRAASLDMS